MTSSPYTDAALIAIAKAATPGPWDIDYILNDGHFERDFKSYVVGCGPTDSWKSIADTTNSDVAQIDHDEDGAWDEIGRRNADFIAAFNPETALSLFARIAALEAKEQAASDEIMKRQMELGEAWMDIDALEAANKELLALLKPFAEAAKYYTPEENDGQVYDDNAMVSDLFEVGDLRRAEKAAGGGVRCSQPNYRRIK